MTDFSVNSNEASFETGNGTAVADPVEFTMRYQQPDGHVLEGTYSLSDPKREATGQGLARCFLKEHGEVETTAPTPDEARMYSVSVVRDLGDGNKQRFDCSPAEPVVDRISPGDDLEVIYYDVAG